jgi:hypothetical protein
MQDAKNGKASAPREKGFISLGYGLVSLTRNAGNIIGNMFAITIDKVIRKTA